LQSRLGSVKRIFFLVVSVALFASTTFSAHAESVALKGTRAFSVIVPSTYKASTPAPLIIALHGYTSSGAQTEEYLKMTPVAEARGILYVYPDGTLDQGGARFWNATPACCNFYKSKVNDEAFIMSIIDTVSKNYNVDQKRIYVIGHSNGGFMTNHMACSNSDRIAAVASFAGEQYADAKSCKASKPISVLQIQGTSDETINYKGGNLFGNSYPGAEKTASMWASLDKCRAKPVKSATKLDIDSSISGSETTVTKYSNCANKTSVELWSIAGGAHVPTLVPDFATKIVNWLLDHPKR
jgi:polyhydroxybutyrate depolymerase